MGTDSTPFADDIGRRRYLKWFGLSGAAALAGCTGDSSNSNSSNGNDGGTNTQSGDIQSGGHLTVGFITNPKSINPMRMNGTAGYTFQETTYSRLTTFDENLNVVPDLAREWEVNDTGDTYTFFLREGAKFATIDQEVLAEDVKATVDVLQSKERIPNGTKDLGPLETVEVLDDHRVALHLKTPSLSYPMALGETGSWFNILPKNVIEDRWDELTEKDFGSGPFNLQSFERGSEYKFKANPDYFKEDDQGNSLPYLDEMTWSVNPDAVSRVNALADGRLDAVQMLSTSNISRVENTDGLNTEGRTSPSFQMVVMTETLSLPNGDQPFSKLEVRQALKHALDREELKAASNDQITLGHHDSVAPVHPNYADFPAGLEFGTTAQPEEARKLLDEAGYDDGLQLPDLYYAPNNPITEPMVQTFQEQMQTAGIEFGLQRVTQQKLTADIWNSEDNWYWNYWSSRFNETTVHRLALLSDADWNEGKYSNEEFDTAYQKYSNAQNEETYIENFTEAQRIVHMTGPWLMAGFEKKYTAYHDYVNNIKFPGSNSRSYHWNDWLAAESGGY